MKQVDLNVWEVTVGGMLARGRIDKILESEEEQFWPALESFLKSQGSSLAEATIIVHIPYWGRVIPYPHRAKALYFDCMDWTAGFGDLRPIDIIRWEKRLAEIANGVVCSSRPLQTYLSTNYGVEAPIVRNGCDYMLFELARMGDLPIPKDLKKHVGRPLIGYVGAIAEWFDTETIELAALTLPEYDFVLVGDYFYAKKAKALKILPNVSLLGEKPYVEVPSYMQQFDICLIPFRKAPIVKYTNPVKLYEYLACGKPVIVSDVMPDLPEAFPDLGSIYYYNKPEDFIPALRTVVEMKDTGLWQQYTLEGEVFAKESTWDIRAQEFREALCVSP
jgi:glycosyltransferase involved in cell wall biosynthesis